MRGETVYIDGITAVENVLVSPTGATNREGSNAETISLPVGPICDYTLYFPISYTGELANHTIAVRGHMCDVIGYPDHERPDQVFDGWWGQWDMTVKVQRTQAQYAETISVKAVTVTRDTLGRRTKTTETLYTGPAQVRLSQMTEAERSDATTQRETRYFVFPWQAALNGLQTQEVFIEWNGKDYDVKSIDNLDEKSETASLEATWHD